MTAAYIDAAKQIAGQELSGELATDILACENELNARLGSHVETVEKIGSHVTAAGGKRLRPLFVSLGARAAGRDFLPQRVAAIGACVEMIHMATLIHDDVIDHAETRRGRPTASAIWGNTASILTGDVLLAKAMDILAEDGDLRIIRTVSKAVVEMAEGEVMEVEARGDFDLSEERHLEILRRKTAALISCCCRVGAQIAGADPQTESALAEYGEAIGIGFQIADDLLDFLGDHVKTGKPRATDFREGCATLPLIHLRDNLSAGESVMVRAKFGNGATEQDLDQIATLLREKGSVAEASRQAACYCQAGAAALETLPDTPARSLLSGLAELMVRREA